jgi:hypothetical protein
MFIMMMLYIHLKLTNLFILKLNINKKQQMGHDLPTYMKINYNESGKPFCPALCPLKPKHIKILKNKCTIDKPCEYMDDQTCLDQVDKLIEVCKDCIPTKYS